MVSYVAFALPAFLLMLVFSAVYASYGSLPRVASVFSGLQVIVVAIVANATYTFARGSLKHWVHILLAAVSAGAFWLGVSPFYVILGAALAGICFTKGLSERQPAHARKAGAGLAPFLGLLGALAAGLVLLYFTSPGLFNLAQLMLKIDLFAFGGGFASLPLMLNQVVHVRGWMDEKTFMDGIALG
jgi:chromate transporter